MARLTPEQIDEGIGALEGWKRKRNFITKEFEFGKFMDGIRFVDQVAEVAQKMDHHPDIHIRWTTVRLEIQTHDEGGVTTLDMELAARIERRLKLASRKTRKTST